MTSEPHAASERLPAIVAALAPLIRNDTRLAQAAALFREALRPGIARGIVDAELAAIAAGRAPRLAERGDGTLRLWSNADARTELRIVRAGRTPGRAVLTLTRHTLLGNAGRAPFLVRRWVQPQPHPNDVFDPARTLARLEDVTLAPGEALALRAGYDAYDVVAQDRPAVALSVAGPVTIPLGWQHRCEDGRPVRAVPAGRALLRLLEVIAFADAIGDEALLPALSGVSEHPSHFARWAAAKTALRVAPKRRDEMLCRLAADAHPQIRRAAEALRREVPV
jgi:hypothetical protein